jgi:hypothetical protein
MGIVINPRGTSGSGKTELVRRVLAQYGWRRGAPIEDAGGLEPICREGRSQPLGYRLRHPLGGRPLAVVGHYEVTSGGCDTIRTSDGGLDEIIRRAADHAATGDDVLLEGLRLSAEFERSAALARSHRLHILRLTTPLDQCARNLVWRRRARRDAWTSVAGTVAVEHEKVRQTCDRLSEHATVEILGFDDAFARAQDLLGIGQRACCWSGGLSRRTEACLERPMLSVRPWRGCSASRRRSRAGAWRGSRRRRRCSRRPPR